MSPDGGRDPIADARALVEKVFALALEAQHVRQRLSMPPLPQEAAAEAERVVCLGMASSFENSWRRALDEAVATLKTIGGDEAQAWLRRRLEGLGKEGGA